MRLVFWLALGLAAESTPAGTYQPPLSIVVAPAVVTAGSTGNTLTFTLMATKRAAGSAAVVVPAVPSGLPWSAPQMSDATQPGHVSAQKGTCAKVKLAAVTPASSAGASMIVVNFKCRKNGAFSIVYGDETGATAASPAGIYQFTTQARRRRWRTKDANRPDPAKGFTQLATQPVVDVAAGPPAGLEVTGPSSAVAGEQHSVTVTAVDAFGNVVTGYTGNVQFSSIDAQAELPRDYTFVAADAGVHAFSGGVTLKTAGTRTVTATDTSEASITGVLTVAVIAAPVVSLELTGIADAVAGTAQDATVTAYDEFGNVATGYTGTVHFASNDAQAELPGDHTFTAADAGVHSSQVVLKTALSPESVVSASDTDAPLLADSVQVTISPGKASQVLVEVDNSDDYPAFSGGPFPGIGGCGAEAKDPYGNVTPSTQLVWSSTDPYPKLPAVPTPNPFFYYCNFATVGTQILTVADASDSSVKGTAMVNVTGGPTANPNDVTVVDPTHTYGTTKWMINVLENDVQTHGYIYNPFLQFYNEIAMVQQPLWFDGPNVYQVGVLAVSGDLHSLVWDLDPLDNAYIDGLIAPGAILLRCPPPDTNGIIDPDFVCHIPAPIHAGYAITDGANVSSTDLTLHLETPNSPTTPSGVATVTASGTAIAITSDAAKIASMSTQTSVNVPVLQPVQVKPNMNPAPPGGISVNLNFNNLVSSSPSGSCTNVSQCTVVPTTVPATIEPPPSSMATLTAGGGSVFQGISFPQQPLGLRGVLRASCILQNSALSDIWRGGNGGLCSDNNDCDLAFDPGGGVCTNGVCTEGFTGSFCSQIPVVADSAIQPPPMAQVQIVVPPDPNKPTTEFTVLGVFKFFDYGQPLPP